jgi:hypothetical protein
MVRQLGRAPTDPADVATKAYVDVRTPTRVVTSTTDPLLGVPYVWVQVDASNNFVSLWVNPTGTTA